MLLHNTLPEYGLPLLSADQGCVSMPAAAEASRYLSSNIPTSLHSMPACARGAGVASVQIKNEGERLGLGSFKALGCVYAMTRIVLAEASQRLGREVGSGDLATREIRAIAATLTVGCATDGNHGRSIAAVAKRLGARAAVFVHEGVSESRVEAIAEFGALIIRVPGSYDDAVAEASRRCAEEGWLVVSDTSWPGYEQIPRLIMQGYTVLVREALEAMDQPPTHVFIQAGVGGLAAAVSGHLAACLGPSRPHVVVVEPARAACLFESARAGFTVRIARGEPTVMAMLECYEPSHVAWRILSRVADAFMTVEEEDAVDAMCLLARPLNGDPALVAGESGAVGLAGFLRVAGDTSMRTSVGLDEHARVLVINTEGATDPVRYMELVGAAPPMVEVNPIGLQ